MLAVSGIRLALEEPDELAAERAVKKLGISPQLVKSARLRRISYDARHGTVHKVCSALVELENESLERELSERCADASLYEKKTLTLSPGKSQLAARPVVIGFGPAGMFAACLLSEYGYRPLVLERGGPIERRVDAVEGFFAGGSFDTECNVQFGEGGAGAFSDGKLTTRINDPLCDYVLESFMRFGAPEDILYKAKPHIGTDRLRGVVRAMREHILRCGGEIRFGARVDDLVLREQKLCAVRCGGEEIPAGAAVLCCGHSARDTFEMLRRRGLTLSPKPFSVGVRIEHLQSDIDRAVFGKFAESPLVPRGEYALSAKAGGRGVYTFCMCPGGTVVAAASESGGVVVNGMSEYARAGKNANSAVVVSVGPEDFGGDPFAAIAFQRRLEKAAYEMGGGGFCAPAQDLQSFLNGKAGLRITRVEPSYPRGVRPGALKELFGETLSGALAQGIRGMGRRLYGFDGGGALLTGVETRTSSPVRIERGEDRTAPGAAGLYPCGEGAGYAGGIMSAAIDGLKTAAEIIGTYSSL